MNDAVRNTSLRLAICLFFGSLVAVVSIAFGAPPEPQFEPIPVAVDTCQFERPEIEKRFRNFDAAARQVTAVGFEHQTYRHANGRIEHTVSADWAKGVHLYETSQQHFLRGPIELLEQTHRITVEVVSVPFPQAKSTGVTVQFVSPNPNDWSLTLTYHEGIQNVVGQNWLCTLYRWDLANYGKVVPFNPAENRTDSIRLPMRGYQVRDSWVETTTGLASNRTILEDFLSYARSANDMRDAYLADLKLLEERTYPVIQQHKARKRVLKPRPPYDDRPSPKQELEPLTAEEETAELEKAKTYFAVQRRLMIDQHKEIYAAMQKAFPLDVAWPELKERQ